MGETILAGAPARGGLADLTVWRIDLRRPADWVETMAARVLGGDEREEAEGAAPDVRRRRLVARIALRLALAERLGRRPAELALARGARGKPELAGADGVHFSVSRCGELCLIAVTSLGPVGVDVERVAPRPELDAIAARRFASEEIAALERLDATGRLVGFYRCWTRKEAYLKATADGLTALDAVTVTVGERPEILAVRGSAPRPWTLRGVHAGAGVVGAVAVAGAHALPEAPIEAAPHRLEVACS